MAREMKNSGVEWIENIPSEWEIRRNKTLFVCSKEIIGKASKITQLLSLTTQGVKTKSPDATGGKVPESFDTYQIVMPDDIVMCLFDLDCSAVFSGISPYYGMISPAYKIIKCKSGLLPKYADYWFRFVFDGRKFKSYAKNLRYTLNYDEFAVLPFALPNIGEQERIATFLDHICADIDEVIKKTKATIEEYKILRQSLITQAVTKGIHKGCNMVSTEYEWIGEIPSHWKTIKAKWLLGERRERSQEGKEEPLSMSQKFGLIPTKEMDMIPNMASSFVGAKLVYVGDFVFNKLKAHLGVFAVSKYEGLVSPDYAVYYPSGVANVKYLEYLFKTPQYIAEFRKKSSGVGAGLTRLYTDDLFSIYCSVPPIEEQEEIISYLDKQCAEIDTLIEKKTALLEELESYKKSVIYEYVTGKKECVQVEQSGQISVIYPNFPAVYIARDSRFAQAVLMCKILDKCRKKMGRVKLEKIMFTIETGIGFNFDTEYVREFAGPLDSSIYECEGIISKSNKWFTVKSSEYGVSYVPTKESGKYKKYYDKYFGEYDAEIERIIGIFMNYDADQAEIIATLFAAWNDAIIEKKQVSDEEIVDDVLNNWNDSKKRFPKDVWLRAIEQMRKDNIVPKGYGKHTVKKS